MSADRSDRVDEVANDLDELKTAVEELEDDASSGADPNTVDRLKHAVDKAIDAADELEDQNE